MPKKNKKKLKKKVLVLFIIFIVLILGLIYYLVFPQNITNIYIKGNNYLTDYNIIKIAKLDNYPNTFKMTSKKIENNLLESPYIKEVKVKKKFFYIVDITLEENKILFIRLDTNKLVFSDYSEIDYDEEVLVAPYLLNYVPNTKYETLIKKMSKIDSSVINKISEIKYDPNDYDEDRFLLYMNDSNKVYVTLTKFDLLNKYNDAVKELEGKTGTLYLDSGNYFKIEK